MEDEDRESGGGPEEDKQDIDMLTSQAASSVARYSAICDNLAKSNIQANGSYLQLSHYFRAR